MKQHKYNKHIQETSFPDHIYLENLLYYSLKFKLYKYHDARGKIKTQNPIIQKWCTSGMMAKQGCHFGGSNPNLPDNRTPFAFDRSLFALFNNNSNSSLVTMILIFFLLHPSWRTSFEGIRRFPRRIARSGKRWKTSTGSSLVSGANGMCDWASL